MRYQAYFMCVVVMMAGVLQAKTRTDILLPREELGPEALVEVVTWAREVVAAGKRGDADACRSLLVGAPAEIAVLPPDVPGDGPLTVLPPVGEPAEPVGPVVPVVPVEPVVISPVNVAPVIEECPDPEAHVVVLPSPGALHEVMSWCNGMLTAARDGDEVRCRELLARVPLAAAATVAAEEDAAPGKSGGGEVSKLVAALIGVGCFAGGCLIMGGILYARG